MTIDKNVFAEVTAEQLLDPAFYDALFDEYYPAIRDDGATLVYQVEALLLQRAAELKKKTDVAKFLKAFEARVGGQYKEDRRRAKMDDLAQKTGFNYEKFLKFNDKGDPVGVNQDAVFEDLIESIPIIVYKKKPYIYADGVYLQDSEGQKEGMWIKSRIRDRIFPDFRTSDIISKIYARVAQDERLLVKEVNQHPTSWVNFRNGHYDMKTGEWFKHDPSYYSINQIPWSYDPNDTCSGDVIESFLDFALYKEGQKELFLQFCALSMTTDASFQKFLLLVGPGGNGKSVLINLLDAVIGDTNLTHLKLQKLNNDRFAKVRLLGKLVNSNGDLNTDKIDNCDELKILTGGDGESGEYKGLDSFEFKSYAKLIFSVNGVPRIIGEESDAVFRRMLILTVDRKPSEEDSRLGEKLVEQMPYFLQLCVQAGKKLFNRQKFCECLNSDRQVEYAKADSNSVDAFLAACTERNLEYRELRSGIQQAYKDYCEEYERTPKSRNQLHAILRSKGFNPDFKSGGTYYVCGLRLKPGTLTPTHTEIVDEDLPDFSTPIQQGFRPAGETLEAVDPNLTLIQTLKEQIKQLQKQNANLTSQNANLERKVALITKLKEMEE